MQHLSYLPYFCGLLNRSRVKIGYPCTANGASPAILGIATGIRPSVYYLVGGLLLAFGTPPQTLTSPRVKAVTRMAAYNYRRSTISIYYGSFTPTCWKYCALS